MAVKVSIHHLSFTYRKSSKPALIDINAHASEGEYVVIMGAGGSGKSSLCYSLNGIIPHLLKGTYDGRVVVGGLDTEKFRVVELARSVSIVLQDFESQLFSSTVELEIAFGLENFNIPKLEINRRVNQYLKLIRLDNRRHDPPAILSDGQKQLLVIGSVLALEPRLLIMDEPTTDLGSEVREYILDLASKLRENGSTLIVTDHRSETALTADTVWVLKNGSLCRKGSPLDIMTDLQLLSDCAIRPLELVKLFMELGLPLKLVGVEEAERIIRAHYFTSRATKGIAETDQDMQTSGSHLIEINDLSYSYKNSKESALRRINLNIGAGEFIAIIGPNGAGKTTLAKQMVRLLEPTTGQVIVDNQPIQSYSRKQLAQIISYVFQNPDHQIFESTVSKDVSFSLSQFGYDPTLIQKRLSESLEAVGLVGYEEADPVQLTKGERQRVAIASALVTKPRILILDEPTKGLDYNHQMRLMNMLENLYRKGHNILLITHSLWIVAEYAKRIIVMCTGEIKLDGPTRSVFAQEELLESYGIKLPPLVRLSNQLGLQGMTVEQIVQEIKCQ